MTVSSRWIDIPASGNSFQGYLALPKGGKGPGVVIIQEIFGVNSHIRAVADQYAADGYVALAPDIFRKKWWTQKSLGKYGGAELKQYWFEGKNLEEAVQKLLKERKLDVQMKLLEAADPTCRVYVLCWPLAGPY